MINEKVKNNNVTDIIKTPKKSIIPIKKKKKIDAADSLACSKWIK